MSPEGQPYSKQKFLRAKTFASKGLPLHYIVGAILRGCPFHLTAINHLKSRIANNDLRISFNGRLTI